MSNPARRLYVVEAMFSDGTWEPCTFGDHPFASDHPQNARDYKNALIQLLHKENIHWVSATFRVVEYGPITHKKRK
jgi:hypothetical protein